MWYTTWPKNATACENIKQFKNRTFRFGSLRLKVLLHNYSKHMSITSPTHSKRISKTCYKHTTSYLAHCKTIPRFIASTSPKNGKRMPNIMVNTYPNHGNNISKTSPTHPQNIAKTCQTYPQDIPKTLPTTWEGNTGSRILWLTPSVQSSRLKKLSVNQNQKQTYATVLNMFPEMPRNMCRLLLKNEAPMRLEKWWKTHWILSKMVPYLAPFSRADPGSF